MTTIGQPCLHCQEPVQQGEPGRMIITPDGRRPVHRECLLRMLCGSVGHQKMECGCFGGDKEDPIGMTKREAAKAAAEMAEAKMQGRN